MTEEPSTLQPAGNASTPQQNGSPNFYPETLDEEGDDLELQAKVEASTYHVLDDWVVYVVIFLGTVLTTGLPVLLGQQLCLPLLNGLVIAPLFIWALRAGRPRRAIELGLFWAVCQTVSTVAATLLLPELASRAIWDGLSFRTEMFTWIDHGQGRPGMPAAFLPQAARNYGIFAALSLATGGMAAFVFLAKLLNTFNFYVATLVQHVASPLLLALAAWPTWLIIRLVGFMVTGAVLAEPVAVLDLRPDWWRRWWQERRRLLAIGLGILLLSIVLQLLLSPIWPAMLRQAVDFS
jgi:hypothetical protein